MRDDRGWCGPQPLFQNNRDTIAREYLDGGDQCRLGQPMRVDSDKQGTVDSVRGTNFTQRLGDGENMILVEGPAERRSSMPRRAENNLLRRVFRIGLARKIGGDKPGNIGQDLGWRGLPGQFVRCHPSRGTTQDIR